MITLMELHDSVNGIQNVIDLNCVLSHAQCEQFHYIIDKKKKII